jgi:hypothetical protein
MRHLRAKELKLLQDRTKLQRRIEEAIGSATWSGETVQELNHNADQLETELHAVRDEMRRLDREEAAD